jgi:hypothetical protein
VITVSEWFDNGETMVEIEIRITNIGDQPICGALIAIREQKTIGSIVQFWNLNVVRLGVYSLPEWAFLDTNETLRVGAIVRGQPPGFCTIQETVCNR